MKKSCIFYDSWAELIINLPDDMAGELIKMILGYTFDEGTCYSENQAINAMFAMIKLKLDEDTEAYEEVIRQRSEAGKRGMASRWNKTSDNKPITKNNEVITNDNSVKNEITNITVYDSVSDNESDKDKKEKEQKKKFTRPSVDEVREYCQERSNGIDPEAFIDFYESKGWKVGNQPMKDWKAAVRTWEKRNPKPANKSSPDIPKVVYDKIHNYEERDFDWNALERELING